MTLKECKEKYPIGSVKGTFIIDNRILTREEVKQNLRLPRYKEYFYIFRNHEYHLVIPYYKHCDGYSTTDGEDFHPYTTENEYFDYLDYQTKETEYLFSLINNEDDEELKEKLIEAWREKNIEKPITNLKQLVEVELYDF